MAKDKVTHAQPNISIELGGNKVSQTLVEREFKSGKKGYGLYDKVQDPESGARYQVSLNMVRLQD